MAAESKRPPGTRRSIRLPRSRPVLLPALSGFENKSRARDGHERDEDSKLRSLEGCLHGYDHRIPAPIVRAIALSSAMTHMKRARFAFIWYSFPQCGLVCSRTGSWAASRGRSLALRLRLATGLPWTIFRAGRRPSSRGENVRSARRSAYSQSVPVPCRAGVRRQRETAGPIGPGAWPRRSPGRPQSRSGHRRY